MSTSNTSQSNILPRKVVICYDESEAGRQTLEWVNSHGILLPTDELSIVTVVNEDLERIEGIGSWATTTVGGVGGVQDYRTVVKHLEKQGRIHLAEAVEAIQTLGVRNVNAKILQGHNASEAIVQYVKEFQPDMVICGSRGRGYLKRKLLGSVSDFLVHHLECTVMIIRAHSDAAKS